MQQQYPFQPHGASQIAVASTTTIAVTAAPQQVTIPVVSSNGGTMRLANIGTQTVHWLYGNVAVSTSGTAMGVPILANTVETFTIPSSRTQLSVIASAIGSNFYITVGDGL